MTLELWLVVALLALVANTFLVHWSAASLVYARGVARLEEQALSMLTRASIREVLGLWVTVLGLFSVVAPAHPLLLGLFVVHTLLALDSVIDLLTRWHLWRR